LIRNCLFMSVVLLTTSVSAQQAAKPASSNTQVTLAAVAPTENRDWSPAKSAYVQTALTRTELTSNVAKAERSARVALSPDARTAILSEYAAAEYEARHSDIPIKSAESQQAAVVTDFLLNVTTSHDSAGFSFKTEKSGTKLFVRSHASYGRLKVTLNPPIEAFTVIIGTTSYDSENTFVLLAGAYAVVVDRRTEKCSGNVRVVGKQTATFACH